MNKADLIAHIAVADGISKGAADKVVAVVFDVVAAALKKGEDIVAHGFGSFSVSERAARVGCNLKTGAEITIPAALSPKLGL